MESEGVDLVMQGWDGAVVLGDATRITHVLDCGDE